MATLAVKVRVATFDATEMARLASELERHGLQVRRRLPPLGLITGDIDPSRLKELRGVDGVEAVELEGNVQLPPFDPDAPQ